MIKSLKNTRKFLAAVMMFAILLSLFINVPVKAKADGIDLEDVESGITIMLYDNTNGLATSEANDVYQTPDGFIWIGIYSGLYRYDGRDFTNSILRNVGCANL